MTDTNKSLSRRNFLKGSAVLAAGAATVGLASCAPDSPSSASGSTGYTFSSGGGGSWDKETDVIVVGTGTATFAALSASHYGADGVVLLEKSPVMFGGTTATSGGGMGIPLSDAAKEEGVVDSKEAVLTYYRTASFGRADMAVAEAYVDNGNEFMKWGTETFGFKWGFNDPAFQDYYEPCEGFLAFGRGSINIQEANGEKLGAGPEVWAHLQKLVKDDGNIELMMETPATSLVVEDGKVTGVVALEKGKNEIRIHARKGVVLGTGGFDHNDEMRRQYLPYPLFVTNAAITNTGDGHKMGMAIGADLSNMDRSWGVPNFITTGEKYEDLLAENRIVSDYTGNDWALWRGRPGALVVNKAGERFGDEAQVYDVFNRDFGQFSSKAATFPNIPAFFICDSAYTAVYPLPGQEAAGDPLPEFFVQAETIEELAQKLGIDAAGLAAELAEFNANAAQGIDPKFGRGTKAIDLNSTGLYGGMREDTPNPCLAPVVTAPFFGAVYVPGTCGTNGGLKINPNSQVVAIGGDPIEGLYAVGNCSCGVTGGAYCSGGMTVGGGSVMSWVAIRHMLGIA